MLPSQPGTKPATKFRIGHSTVIASAIRLSLGLFALVCLGQVAFAQSTATPVTPGYLDNSGCPPGFSVCFHQYGAAGGTGGAVTQGTTPWVTQQNGGGFTASGKTPLTCTLDNVTSVCGPFTPLAGRSFDPTCYGTFVQTLQLKKSFDGGTTKLPITAAGTVLYIWTSQFSEAAEEDVFGVNYYIVQNAYTSGSATCRFDQ